MYWPAVLAASFGLALTAGLALRVELVVPLVPFAQTVLGILAAFLFLLLVIDKEARGALDAYNLNARRRVRLRWSEWIFPLGIDRCLMALALVAWVEGIALHLRGEGALAILPALSFFVSGLMAMLMLRKTSWAQEPPQGEPGRLERETGFWIGGDGGD